MTLQSDLPVVPWPTAAGSRAADGPTPDRGAWSALGFDVLAATVGLGLLALGERTGHRRLGVVTLLVAACWVMALGRAGSYRAGVRRLGRPLGPVWSALALCATIVALPALLLAARRVQEDVGGSLIVLAGATALVRTVRHQWGPTRRPARVLVVGRPSDLEAHGAWGGPTCGRRRAELVGTCSVTEPTAALVPAMRHEPTDTERSLPTTSWVPADGIGGLLAAIESTGADTVALLVGSGIDSETSRRLSWALADRGVTLTWLPDMAGAGTHRVVPVEVDGVSALLLRPAQLAGPSRVVKSLLERSAAALALIPLAPLLLLIAVSIRTTSPGPALFRQSRTGRDGEPFVVYKFRTMRQGSPDQFLAMAEASGQGALFFKLTDDPRITRVGGLLRRTSLDELPQLFNVVLGTMSLVGPRPLPSEVDQSTGDVPRRLRVLPGITGLWQVSGRSSLSPHQAVGHDLDYVDNWDLGLDLSILRRTLKVVLRGDGAC